jgi:hypothetical protein
MHATSTLAIKNWDETTVHEQIGGGKLSRVSAKKTYTGEIEGEGVLEYLMAYRLDEIVTFAGLERIVGRLGGRSGSFVIQINGVFAGGAPDESFSVVPNSATGELAGLAGRGRFTAGPSNSYHLELDYEFAPKGEPGTA